MQPVLTGWAGRYASLREVTRQDILDAIDARHGPVIQHRIVALRSLFRALRQDGSSSATPPAASPCPRPPGCRSHCPPTASPGSSTAPARRPGSQSPWSPSTP